MHSLAVLLPAAVLAALPAGGKEGDDAQAVVRCRLTRLLRLCLCLQGGTFSLQDVDSEEQYPRGHFAGCFSEIMLVDEGVVVRNYLKSKLVFYLFDVCNV